MMNLVDKLIENYVKVPNKICLIQKEQKVTYKKLYNMVINFKNYLEQQGIKKEQKILVLVPMSIELYVCLLSLWSIGAVACFMDAGFIKKAMYNNDFSNINGVIGNTKYILYANVNNNLKNLKIKVNINKIKIVENDSKLEVEKIGNNYPAILTYTSGTTGKPKIAVRTHEFLNLQGKILEENLNYENTDIEISTMPIFTLSNINVGITTIITNVDFSNIQKTNPEKIINKIIKEKANRIMAAPGLLNVILDYCIKKQIKIDFVRKIFTGGGAVFLDFIGKLKKVFTNARIIIIYGSTEAEPIAELDVNNITSEDIEKIKNGYGILAGKVLRSRIM